MKRIRSFQYHTRRLLLGADPEALLFAAALAVVVLGLSFSFTNPLVLAGGFLLLIYVFAIVLWLRKNYG